jgi:hypothetical protein
VGDDQVRARRECRDRRVVNLFPATISFVMPVSCVTIGGDRPAGILEEAHGLADIEDAAALLRIGEGMPENSMISSRADRVRGLDVHHQRGDGREPSGACYLAGGSEPAEDPVLAGGFQPGGECVMIFAHRAPNRHVRSPLAMNTGRS